MQNVITFLLNNLPTVISTLVLLCFIVALVVQKRWVELRKAALMFIKLAEKTIIGSKVGQERFIWVLEQVYTMTVPKWLQMFITREMVAKQLQIWFDELIDFADDGVINKSSEHDTDLEFLVEEWYDGDTAHLEHDVETTEDDTAYEVTEEPPESPSALDAGTTPV